ncbi:type III secretion system export apparatus subunit SctR [Terasakiella pusilla]|jgi:type III secretion protein R|uniref:type III secretion system export apparatus subunit SctR n=1 Tax=Terasakiella pusilla TaxID=64973 RepID=UPI00048FBFE8|nr:type III secretion system export apparatus subunit SctR [Terasakiella pusilla]
MTELPNPMTLIGAMSALALLPFIAIMVTSFVKFAVVLSLVRNALGVQQIPPNSALYGLSIILTLYVMAPVGHQIYQVVQSTSLEFTDPAILMERLTNAAEPLRQFLAKHANDAPRDFFVETTRKIWPEELAAQIDRNSYFILIPAFTVSELTAAFEIGFLLYLPFIAIDLIISNILLAMGMMMVSPMTISLPFKLFLFVAVEGWTRLIYGLVLSYQ